MKITDIQAQKKTADRFSIFVDGKYSFSLSGNDLLEQKIKIGLEVTEPDLERYSQLSRDSIVLVRTYDKCLRRPHSVKEIRDYLRRKMVDEDLRESILSKCIDKNLVNDDYFAERWIEMRLRNNRSKQRIRQELQQKGVSGDIISKHLNVIDDDRIALRAAIEKKQKRYADDPAKLLAYLQRQGFRYHDIQAELTNLTD